MKQRIVLALCVCYLIGDWIVLSSTSDWWNWSFAGSLINFGAYGHSRPAFSYVYLDDEGNAEYLCEWDTDERREAGLERAMNQNEWSMILVWNTNRSWGIWAPMFARRECSIRSHRFDSIELSESEMRSFANRAIEQEKQWEYNVDLLDDLLLSINSESWDGEEKHIFSDSIRVLGTVRTTVAAFCFFVLFRAVRRRWKQKRQGKLQAFS